MTATAPCTPSFPDTRSLRPIADTLQDVSKAQRRSVQEGARALRALLRRRRCHHFRPQQEAVRVFIWRHQRDYWPLPIRECPFSFDR
jgi:hypothetical protein